MKHIPGADPELVLLNHYYEELDVRAEHLFNYELVFVCVCVAKTGGILIKLWEIDYFNVWLFGVSQIKML